MSSNCGQFGRYKERVENLGAGTSRKLPTWENEKKMRMALSWILMNTDLCY